MLRAASGGDQRVPASELVAILHDKGLTGKELLTHVSALYVLQRGPNGHLIKSDLHFLYAVGGCVITLRSQDGARVKGRHRVTLGEFLVKNLGVLCLNIFRAIEQQENKQKDIYRKYNEPLTV